MNVELAFSWRHALFANWSMDPESVAERLPDVLDVETFDGRAWLSIIPFVNVDVRPEMVPISQGFTAPELNLRTYVTCDGEPGIYFFSLDMESLLGVLGARLTHHLPYHYSDMAVDEHDGRVSFTSRRRPFGDRPAHFDATYRWGEAFDPDPGSLSAFLVRRRRLYTQAADGSVRYTEVHHEPWPLCEAECEIRENGLFEANGFATPASDPTLYYSPGVSVTASPSRPWR